MNYIATSVPQRYMVDDQRFAARRPDVLVYQSEPLEDDVTIAGPISPKLSVASTGMRFRLCGQTHRRVPNDYPDNEVANATKRVLGQPFCPHGRVPAIVAR